MECLWARGGAGRCAVPRRAWCRHPTLQPYAPRLQQCAIQATTVRSHARLCLQPPACSPMWSSHARLCLQPFEDGWREGLEVVLQVGEELHRRLPLEAVALLAARHKGEALPRRVGCVVGVQSHSRGERSASEVHRGAPRCTGAEMAAGAPLRCSASVGGGKARLRLDGHRYLLHVLANVPIDCGTRGREGGGSERGARGRLAPQGGSRQHVARTVRRLASGVVADDHHVDLAPRCDARQTDLVADSHDALLARLELRRFDPRFSRRLARIVNIGGVNIGHDLLVHVDRKLRREDRG